MDCSKYFKSCNITFVSELPPKSANIDNGTRVAVTSEISVTREKQGQFNVYTWSDNEWVFTSTIDTSDNEFNELEELKNAYDDLNNAVKRLIKVSANTENDELFSKISKITTKILQAKYELNDNVIEQLEGD